MSLPTACCQLPPVQSNYIPKGTTFDLGDMTIYETADKTPNRALICAYDIFGFHPNTKQVADTVAQAGFRVVMPDFFRGQYFSLENFPPIDRAPIYKFAEEKGNWTKTVKTDLLKVLNHYKDVEGVTSFGIFGFCWGARVSIDALVEIGDIQAAGLIHPSFWTTEDAEKIFKPTLLIPTKDDGDMIPFYNILKKNLGEENCYHRRIEDIHHGFCSARANLDNELNRRRVDESIEALQKFMNKHVK